MRQSGSKVSLQKLCALFRVTRQAYYEVEVARHKTSIAHMIVLTLVKELRTEMPMLGCRKLLYLLQPEFIKHGIKMGRDQLFDLLAFHGLLIRKRRRRTAKTTDSEHWLKKYPNQIIDIVVCAPEQLWVSDITYIRTLEGFSYLSLITDAYSRKIVGYALCPTLEAIGCLEALQMALNQRVHKSNNKLIHHSDRGIQYCCFDYVQMLLKEKIAISMTQSGSPYENAMAERVNGIIKNDFFPKIIYQNHEQAQKAINKIIQIYNAKRPHLSLNYMTPEQAHRHEGEIKKCWKQYSKKTKQKNVIIEMSE